MGVRTIPNTVSLSVGLTAKDVMRALRTQSPSAKAKRVARDPLRKPAESVEVGVPDTPVHEFVPTPQAALAKILAASAHKEDA